MNAALLGNFEHFSKRLSFLEKLIPEQEAIRVEQLEKDLKSIRKQKEIKINDLKNKDPVDTIAIETIEKEAKEKIANKMMEQLKLKKEIEIKFEFIKRNSDPKVIYIARELIRQKTEENPPYWYTKLVEDHNNCKTSPSELEKW